MKKQISIKFYIYIFSLFIIAIELFCVKLAFLTLGTTITALYYFLIAINIVPVVLLLLKKYKGIAISSILIIGTLIIPYQLYLGSKLIDLKEEAANITAYLYEQQIKNKTYPNDLTQYIFNNSDLAKHFIYSPNDNSQFVLNYYVGSADVSYFYNSEFNRWGYYPD